MKARVAALALTSAIAALARCTGVPDVVDLLPGAPMMEDAGAGADAGKPPAPPPCATGADCTAPAKALCRPSDGACVACLTDMDCATGDACDPQSGACRAAP